MGAADTFITFTLVGGLGAIGAYITNFMGFRDWADTNLVRPVGGQPVGVDPGIFGPGGTETEAPTENKEPPVKIPTIKPAVFKAGSSGNCSWDTRGGWCWNSTACGGTCKTCRTGYNTQNIYEGCNVARTYFLNNYKKCTSCQNKCQYSGCTSLNKGAGCYQCRCSGICKKYPNTHPVTKADGSCTCVKNAPSLADCQKYCNVGGGTAKIVNGNCQCYAPGFSCPYSQYGCANEKTEASCYLCRCRGICRNYPGTYPAVDAKGSCVCRKTASLAVAYPVVRVPTIA